MNRARFGVIIALAAVSGCSETGTTDVLVDVQFPTEAERGLSASVHTWILRSRDSAGTCPGLVSEEMDPYDIAFRRVEDEVFLLPGEPDIEFADVPRATVLVFVRAVDFGGITHLSGCSQVELSGAEQVVPLLLSATGTFDCSDPATAEGAACNDGVLCTVGETCRNGACSGGRPRDCTAISDSCNEARCEEDLGCVAEQLPDGTACEEGLFCSSGGICTGGVCSSTLTDCTTGVDVCEVGICDEGDDRCDIERLPNGSFCDDGQFCTVGDTCSFFLGCRGQPRDCSFLGTGCTTGQCNEMMGACEQINIGNGGDCDDNNVCTMNTTCTNGTCAGGDPTDEDGDGFRRAGCGGNPNQEDCLDTNPAVNPNATEGPGGPTCSDGLDNDCDGLTDALDTNC